MTSPTPPVQPVIEQIQAALDAGPTEGPWSVRFSQSGLGSAELVMPNGGWFLDVSDETIRTDEEQETFKVNLAYMAEVSPANMRILLAAIASKEAEAKEAALKYVSLFGELQGARAEIEELKNDLQFVERWANHHGQKPDMTPWEALSCIQHYPSILAITRSYADGKVPETRNPYAEIERMKAALEQALDDMGSDGHCVCPAAKDMMRATLNQNQGEPK